MEFTGKFVGGLRIDFDTRRLEMTIQSDMDGIGKEWEELRQEQKLRFTVKRYRKKRSLDANAYYWQLLTKLADTLRVSKPYLHNILLRQYGQPEVIDGQMVYLVLPDSESGVKRADEAETYHIRPTSQVKSGNEMSILIGGLIEECKEQGIETLPPDELERMMAAYDQNWRKHHEEAV